MVKSSVLLVLCGIAAIMPGGCASIFCGDHKTISVTSQPPGARFEILNAKGVPVTQGVTPTNVTLKRGRGYFAAGDYTITFLMDPYDPVKMQVPQGLEAGWYLGGNFIFGGLIGWFIVDPLTGAMWNLNDVQATFSRPPEPEKPRPGTTRRPIIQ